MVDLSKAIRDYSWLKVHQAWSRVGTGGSLRQARVRGFGNSASQRGTGGLAEVVLTRAIVRGDGSGAGGMDGLAKVAGWCCVWCGISIMKLPTAKAHSSHDTHRRHFEWQLTLNKNGPPMW